MPKTPAQIETTLREMSRVSQAIAAGIDSDIAALDKRLLSLQRDLYDLLVAEFLTGFTSEDGLLKNTTGNLARISYIDRLFDSFRRSALGGLVSDLGKQFISVADSVSEYFRLGFTQSRVDRIAESNGAINAVIGVKDGKLIQGGYLDRLAQTQGLRDELKQYMTRAIAGKVSITELTKGLGVLVKGNQDADGFLQRYFRQYAYDTYNQVRELKNREFADGLGLKYFIYQGSVISTTRKFCRKRAGKVYTTKEAQIWKNDPDLIEPRTRGSYNPLIERGRYNCRHWIDYISEETAQHLKAKEKTNAG